MEKSLFTKIKQQITGNGAVQTKIADLTVAGLFGFGALLAYLLFFKQINQFDCLKSMLKLLLSSIDFFSRFSIPFY